MIVVGGDLFSKKLAEALGTEFVLIERKTFSDGETCPRLYFDFSDDHVILVNRMEYPFTDPNRYLVETMLLLKAIKSKAERIDLVMPYLVYARQDRAFRTGEPLSCRYVLELLKSAGTSSLFTVSSHAEREKEMLTAPMPAYNINGFVAVADYIKSMEIENAVIVGADAKAGEAAKFLAESTESEHLALTKYRDVNTGEISFQSQPRVQGRNVVLVDDMVTSGGTMIKAIELCKKSGCKKIIAACVHPILAGNALERMVSAADKFVATDTIESPVTEISVVPLVAEKIKEFL